VLLLLAIVVWFDQSDGKEWRCEQRSYIPPFPESNLIFQKPEGNEFYRPSGIPAPPPLNIEPNALEDLAEINKPVGSTSMSGEAPPLPKEISEPDPSAVKMSVGKGMPSAAELRRMQENENRKRLTEVAKKAYRRSPAGKAERKRKLAQAKKRAAEALKKKRAAQLRQRKALQAVLDSKHKSEVKIMTDFRKDKSAEVLVTLKHRGTDIQRKAKAPEKEKEKEKEKDGKSVLTGARLLRRMLIALRVVSFL
jgi:hypothetical protein